MDSSRPSLTVVVPVYNSAAILPELLGRLLPVLEAEASRHEVLLVDDDSRDASWAAIEALAAQHPTVHGLRLMRNYGQHNALLLGIRRASCDVVATLDDDLEHPPEELPKLLAALGPDLDVVYGTPQRGQHGVARNLASRITKLSLRAVLGVETARKASAFRVFRTRLRDAFADYQSPFVSIDVLLTWATTRFGAVAVRHDPRKAGRSNYGFRRLVVHALNMMTGFSIFPLQLASLAGFAFMGFGVGVLIWVVGRYLALGGSVPGFPFLASVIAIFSGTQLFALGIIGEYLARIHFRMMGRPTYAVRSRTEGGGERGPA